MSATRMMLAGFGGQGILFAGKLLAYAGMLANKNVSWLPSYGPEMRGGTANCAVIVSDEEIGSPLVPAPDVLLALNLPSFEKFEPAVEAGGLIVFDSSLIPQTSQRTDVTVCAVNATSMASDEGLNGLANMIMIGKFLRASGLFDLDTVFRALEKCVPPSKAALLETNKQAISLGYNA